MGSGPSSFEVDVMPDELLRASMKESKWRAPEVRILYNWFMVTTKDGRFKWRHFLSNINPSSRLPLSFVSRAWLLVMCLATKMDLSSIVRTGLNSAFKPLTASGGIQLPGMSPQKVEQKDVLDQLIVAEEKKKLRTKLVLMHFAGGPDAGRLDTSSSLAQSGDHQEVEAPDEEEMKLFDARHSLESLGFVEFVRFLREVEIADYSAQVAWAYLLFEEGGFVHPGSLITLGKSVAPVLMEHEAGQKEDESVRVVACITEFFDGKTRMNFEEWTSAFNAGRIVYTKRIKNQPLSSGLGMFPAIAKNIERLREHASNLSCQGRLWIGRSQYKVKVENGHMSTVPIHLEHQGFTETYRLVDTNVVADHRHKSRFEVAFTDGLRLRCDAGTEASAQSWMNAILTNVYPASSSFRFGSFSARRDSVEAKWYVDGAGYFSDVLRVMRAAKEEILITDWSFSPEIYLDREHPDQMSRLDLTLIERARAGVKVHILLWWQSNMAVQGTVNANYVVKRFKGIKNIHVLLHPSGTFPSKWSHHQKSVIVDRAIAFCGGIDLCYGRYDDSKHVLKDDCHLQTRFPGKDFYNPGISTCDNLQNPWEEKLDRYSHPREPWHDIQVGLNKGCALDLARNFVQRWNHHLKETGSTSTHPVMTPVSEDVLDEFERFNFWQEGATEVSAQILRSLSKWSGNHATEQSIYQGYLHAISAAEHFIYIENQFFMSSQGPVQNQIVNTLIERISRAILEKQKFRVVIVLPFHPEGSFSATSTRILYRLEYQTIRHMRKELERKHPLHKFADYVHFASLMQHAKIQERFFIQMIYVHSKLMIVDDRIVICGSANINDRSMLGDRDSELAAFIEGRLDLQSSMGGEPFLVSSFAHSLRVALWSEHLGLNKQFESLIKDPCLDSSFDFWKCVAESNESLLSPIVDVTPADIFAIAATGVAPQVKRHRIQPPKVQLWLRMKDHLASLARTGECRCCCFEEEQLVYPCAVCGENACVKCLGHNLKCHLCEGTPFCPLTHGLVSSEEDSFQGTQSEDLSSQRTYRESMDAMRESNSGGANGGSSNPAVGNGNHNNNNNNNGTTGSSVYHHARHGSFGQTEARRELRHTLKTEMEEDVSGWLEKQRGTSEKLDHLFCQISGNILQYFETEGGKPRGFLELHADMHVQDWEEKPFGFCIADESRAHFYAAESDEQKHRWMNSLRKVLSLLRRFMFKHKAIGMEKAQGFVKKDGRLMDTARDFVQMDSLLNSSKDNQKRSPSGAGGVSSTKLVPPLNLANNDEMQSTFSPRTIPLEGGAPVESEETARRRTPDALPLEESVVTDSKGVDRVEREAVGLSEYDEDDADDDDTGEDDQGRNKQRRQNSHLKKEESHLGVGASEKGKEEASLSQSPLRTQLNQTREKMQLTTTKVQHAATLLGEKIEDKAHRTKEKAKELATKAEHFFKAFSHTKVERRLNEMQGHLLPYPVGYRPRIPADLIAAAPTDIFT